MRASCAISVAGRDCSDAPTSCKLSGTALGIPPSMTVKVLTCCAMLWWSIPIDDLGRGAFPYTRGPKQWRGVARTRPDRRNRHSRDPTQARARDFLRAFVSPLTVKSHILSLRCGLSERPSLLQPRYQHPFRTDDDARLHVRSAGRAIAGPCCRRRHLWPSMRRCSEAVCERHCGCPRRALMS